MTYWVTMCSRKEDMQTDQVAGTLPSLMSASLAAVPSVFNSNADQKEPYTNMRPGQEKEVMRVINYDAMISYFIPLRDDYLVEWEQQTAILCRSLLFCYNCTCCHFQTPHSKPANTCKEKNTSIHM